ncbi:MAG: VCBS repeat-containing protein [Candidatus Aminicenantes bacterium]|nr:VCBS repeat-containing protein [Candidatus Aminicenantes bacterium]
MIIKRKIIPALMLLIFVSFLAGKNKGQERDFGFGAMEIFDFSDHTTDLEVYDIDNDGLDDILFLNNKVSRLEILTRRKNGSVSEEGGFPPLKERFNDKGFVLDNWVISFRVGNINRDKKPDIVTLSEQKGVQVYFQQAKGLFSEPVSFYIKDPAKLKGFDIKDLNGDNRVDVLVFRQENAEILWNNGRGEFKTRSTIDFSDYGCMGALGTDINRDKIPDLLFYFPKEKLSLRTRLGMGEGEFGWEQALPLPGNHVVETLDINGKKGCQLGLLLRSGLVFRLYDFVSRAGKPLFTAAEAVPRRLPLKGISRRSSPTYLTADIDGDGFDDFCVAAPLLSQLHLYKGGASGLSYSPLVIDSLGGISHIAQTGDGDILVFSETEKAVALHKNKNLTVFPTFLKAAGEPLAAAAAGAATIFALYKDKDSKISLDLFDARTPGAGPAATHKLSIRSAPRALKVFPLPGDRHWGVLLFMPYDKPLLYRLQQGKMTPLSAEFFRPLGSNLEPRAVTVVGTEKQQELLVIEGNVARIYRWRQDRFVVAEQLNPRVESARLTAGCRLSTGEPGYLLYDENGQDVYRFLPASSSKITRLHIQDGAADLAGLASLRLKDKWGILFVGQSQLQWLRSEAPELQLENLGEYISRAEKPNLWNLYSVSLGSPGRPMAALLDANNGSIELVGRKNGKLVEELVFKVFIEPGFNERRSENIYEPHDVESGDFNGDKIQDLAILVHNKLLIYLGE